MEERLLETLKGYRDAAWELERTAVSESFDDDIPGEVQTALVRLVAAISIDDRLEKSEAFLTEESTEEIIEAYDEAETEVGRVLEAAFAAVEKYVESDKELERRIELLSVNTESSGLTDDLLKLFKCQGIIHMAYRSAAQYPIYGAPGYTTERDRAYEAGALTDQEKYVLEKTGVDIYALLEIRARLIGDVQRAMGKEGQSTIGRPLRDA